jgi:high affinity Mn2+ porin
MAKTSVFLALLLGAAVLAHGQSPPATGDDSDKAWTLHFQQTVVTQWHPSFSAPYSGTNSLQSGAEMKTSVTATLFLGFRLWRGAEFYVNPELSGGQGFSNARGIAGFPNGEIYRVGNPAPAIYPARLYLKQTIDLGGPEVEYEDGPNQIAGQGPAHRLTILAGKFSLTDFFDNNTYSHDPRTQFLNWALMDAGAWDFAADTRGYTWGVLTEYAGPNGAARLAAVLEPETANGLKMDTHITKAYSLNFELERRYTLKTNKGTVRVMVFRNVARMGSYQEALDNPAFETNIVLTDRYSRTKYGFGINWEQTLSADAGVFARVSWNDGHTESWAFAEIDRSLSLGGLLGGKSWGRPHDQCGVAFVMNGLSKDHADYLAAGGYGFMIGDGRLNYGPETIFEAFYGVPVIRGIWLSADYQFVINPAYNRDRGPVHVFGIRVHTEI